MEKPRVPTSRLTSWTGFRLVGLRWFAKGVVREVCAQNSFRSFFQQNTFSEVWLRKLSLGVRGAFRYGCANEKHFDWQSHHEVIGDKWSNEALRMEFRAVALRTENDRPMIRMSCQCLDPKKAIARVTFNSCHVMHWETKQSLRSLANLKWNRWDKQFSGKKGSSWYEAIWFIKATLLRESTAHSSSQSSVLDSSVVHGANAFCVARGGTIRIWHCSNWSYLLNNGLQPGNSFPW